MEEGKGRSRGELGGGPVDAPLVTAFDDEMLLSFGELYALLTLSPEQKVFTGDLPVVDARTVHTTLAFSPSLQAVLRLWFFLVSHSVWTPSILIWLTLPLPPPPASDRA